ncbi:MAG: hypothetical protein QM811_16715 [Pirellulales bacterium]
MAKKSAKSEVPHVTVKEIQKYLGLDEQRKQLNRESAALKKQADAIEADIEKFIRANGGKELSVTRSGYRLAILTAAGSVAWKDEFVKLAGNERAEELRAAAPPREFLSVEKIA